MTEREIDAIRVGDLLPKTHIGFSPMGDLPQPYQVVGAPPSMVITASLSDEGEWNFSVRGTAERTRPFRQSPPNTGRETGPFLSKEECENNMRVYVRNHAPE